ncbi:hypothetical protein ACFL5O_03925 [Myxococcota bacterium]
MNLSSRTLRVLGNGRDVVSATPMRMRLYHCRGVKLKTVTRSECVHLQVRQSTHRKSCSCNVAASSLDMLGLKPAIRLKDY